MKFIGNTQEDFDKIQVLKTYDDLRAYQGLATQTFISDISGIGGLFVYDPSDTTSSDDSETVMVAGSKRWKRVYSDTPYPALAGGTVDDISATLKSNIGSLPSILECTIISSGMNTGAVTLTVTLGSNVQTTFPIVKFGNIPLDSGDIPDAGYPIKLIYVDSLGVYLMINPSISTTTATTQINSDNSNKIATTEFVKNTSGNYQKFDFITGTSAGESIYLLASDAGKSFEITGSFDCLVYLPTDVESGARIDILNNSTAPFQIIRSLSGNFIRPNSSTVNTDVVALAGDFYSFVYTGSQWCFFNIDRTKIGRRTAWISFNGNDLSIYGKSSHYHIDVVKIGTGKYAIEFSDTTSFHIIDGGYAYDEYHPDCCVNITLSVSAGNGSTTPIHATGQILSKSPLVICTIGEILPIINEFIPIDFDIVDVSIIF